MREAAGQDHDVGALQARLLVPDELGVLPEHVLGRVVRVVIAVGAGKDDDGEFHDWLRSFQLERLLVLTPLDACTRSAY